MPTKKIKLISWNVNGLNAAMQKGFVESLQRMDADIAAIQETKLQQQKRTADMETIDGYASFWAFSTLRKGYSGVATYCRQKPIDVRFGLGVARYDDEGRIIETDFGAFVLFNVYFPNGQMGEDRLQYKLDFYRDFFAYTDALRQKGRSVIVCGDFNTAHNEIDLKNPKANENYSGFLRIERDWMDRIIAAGYVDTFRHFHPDEVKYSWWTYRFKAREKNVGWRIDYVMVSGDIIDKGWVRSAFIDNTVMGSDHCPVGVELVVEAED